MSYKIVVDSCCELPEELKQNPIFEIVPLSIHVDEETIVDDEAFNQADFLKKIAASPNCPKSSCPSPEMYMNAYGTDVDHAYAVTLSAELSGSYNSAELGKKLLLEEASSRKIHVFNSRSASVGETQIALKIDEYEKQGMSFEEIIKSVEQFINDMDTFFVLESLETLRKNGRLTGVKALVASTLNIKPYMCATSEGTIKQLGQARGIQKAQQKMADALMKIKTDTEQKRLMISHCNCYKRAEEIRNYFLTLGKFKEVIILDTAGISTLYANDGGVIVTI